MRSVSSENLKLVRDFSHMLTGPSNHSRVSVMIIILQEDVERVGDSRHPAWPNSNFGAKPVGKFISQQDGTL
jgi:hypothetical protein